MSELEDNGSMFDEGVFCDPQPPFFPYGYMQVQDVESVLTASTNDESLILAKDKGFGESDELCFLLWLSLVVGGKLSMIYVVVVIAHPAFLSSFDIKLL